MSEAEDYQPTEEENAAENEGDNQDTNLNSSEPFDDTKEEEGEINEDEQNVVQITDGGGNPEDQIDNNTNQSGLDDDRLEEEEDIEKRAEENLGEEAEDQEVNENDFEEINDGDTQFDNAPEEQLDEFQSGEVTEVHNDLDNDDELIDQAQTDEEEQRARERAELNYSESEKEDVENKGIQSTPTIDIQAEDYNTDQQIEISQEAADQRTEADNDPSTTSLYEKDDKVRI
uniref:Uncharacterized protein n=1 Tax=Biomphalaria glabrata TaxID=6526 RepID=A0A2C9LVV4_BIOGL